MKRRRCMHTKTIWKPSFYRHLPDGPPIPCGTVVVCEKCRLAFSTEVAANRGILPERPK